MCAYHTKIDREWLLAMSEEKEWDDWRWQMQMRSVCSKVSALIKFKLIPESEVLEIDGNRLGLSPYNLKVLLSLERPGSQAFLAQLIQSLPIKGNDKKHQWVWAKRHDLFWSKFMESSLMPTFLKVLFGGRGSDTYIRALENMYPKTDVLIATAVCARNCSFCFREVGSSEGEASKTTASMKLVLEAIEEIIKRKKPNVLITGGDPFTRGNEQLRQIIKPLVDTRTVKTIRLATRMVVDLPMRFYDKELLSMLHLFASTMKNRGAVLRIVMHVNHFCELTREARVAIKNIQNCGIEILSQTVVLKRVNDDETVLARLMTDLDSLGIRPYKLFHAMPVAETEEMRVSMKRFRELVASLHQWLPGTAVPQANVPTLVGKMPVLPNGRWMIPVPFTSYFLCRSFRGELFFYKDASDFAKHTKEFIVASIVVIVSLITFLSLIGADTRSNDLGYTKVVYLDDVVERIGYPEAWIRQVKKPFTSDGVLYVPMNDFRS